MLKKDLSTKVSSLKINEIYDNAISAGAIGGKILGAGGGGYFLFYVPEKKQRNVKKALSKLVQKYNPDYLIHLAAVSHDNRSNSNPNEAFENSFRISVA